MGKETSKTDFGELLLKEKLRYLGKRSRSQDAKCNQRINSLSNKRPDLFPLGCHEVYYDGPPGCGKTLFG
jgi:hypothetical protein